LELKTRFKDFGGINLEDIAAPRCFVMEERLKQRLDIPVFHDDQHGTAIVVFAALLNALKVVDKRLSDTGVVVSGVGDDNMNAVKQEYAALTNRTCFLSDHLDPR